MDKLREHLRARFGVERVEVAWIGGSATWAAPVPECLGVPAEDILRFSGIETPWGPVGRCRLVAVEGRPLLRIPVHGWLTPEGRFDPGPVASMRVFYLLRELGVRAVIIDASVGGITLAPGDILVASDFIDPHDKPLALEFARRLGLRPWVRLGEPYCPVLRARLIAAAQRLLAADPDGSRPLTGTVHTEGTYVTTPFGVFETAAEIEQYRQAGWSVVGQSAGIETMLARHLGLHLGHISVAANWAEGLEGGRWHGDMAGFYRDCALPMARIGWEVVRSLVLEDAGAWTCSCETIGASTDLTGLPVPQA